MSVILEVGNCRPFKGSISAKRIGRHVFVLRVLEEIGISTPTKIDLLLRSTASLSRNIIDSQSLVPFLAENAGFSVTYQGRLKDHCTRYKKKKIRSSGEGDTLFQTDPPLFFFSFYWSSANFVKYRRRIWYPVHFKIMEHLAAPSVTDTGIIKVK